MADSIATEDRTALTKEVARILLRHSDVAFAGGQIPPHTALIDSGLELSSVTLLEALVEIEQTLNVRLTDEALTVEVLSSFAVFVEHVCNLRFPSSGSRAPSGRTNPG